MEGQGRTVKTLQAPFPYFGGKSRIANIVWEALGDNVDHYLEPFFGSGAVLLARQTWGRNYTETVCDADGHLANVWRSLQFSPEETARWCDWPVNHADLMARKKLLTERTQQLLDGLIVDDKWHDPLLAGYWIWATSCWIGLRLIRSTQRSHLGDKGNGVHRTQRPHLADKGNGVHRTQIPHLGNLAGWFHALAERLRNVRVVCGDWSRICGGDWQAKKWKTVGIFFDPPYSDKAGRDPRIYATDSRSVAHDVRAWALKRGGRENYRIVLAGYYE